MSEIHETSIRRRRRARREYAAVVLSLPPQMIAALDALADELHEGNRSRVVRELLNANPDFAERMSRPRAA